MMPKPLASKNGSLGRKHEEFSVEQVEAVIAELNDKVARLQKDIGALKRTSQTIGSHRATTNLTYARNVDDKSKTRVKNMTKDRGESASFSREPLSVSPESLSCREATKDVSTQQQQQQQRKHALFNAQRKNRALPALQEVNSQADDRQSTLYPNATDFAAPLENCKVLRKRISRGIQYDRRDCQKAEYQVRMKCVPLKNSRVKHRQTHVSFSDKQERPSSGSKARRNETELGLARSIDNEQRDRSAIENMDEHPTRRGIDNEQRDARRYDVDERNRPPVVKPVTTPHRRSKLNELTHESSLDQDTSHIATGAPKSTDEKFINHRKHADPNESSKPPNQFTKQLDFSSKTKTTLAKEKVNAEKQKVEDSAVENKEGKSLKFSEKNIVSKNDKLNVNKNTSKIKSSSNIAEKTKNKPDKSKSVSAPKQSREANSNKFSQKFSSNKKKSASESRTNKSHTKFSDSVQPQYISIKNKLNECTKELNHLIGKVSDLFRKKSNTRK